MSKEGAFPSPEWERDWVRTEEDHLDRPRERHIPPSSIWDIEYQSVIVEGGKHSQSLIDQVNVQNSLILGYLSCNRNSREEGITEERKVYWGEKAVQCLRFMDTNHQRALSEYEMWRANYIKQHPATAKQTPR